MTDEATTDVTTTKTVGESAAKATMREFEHTNPYTGQSFGEDYAFERGPTVAADGGRSGAAEQEEQTVRDVDHEHPNEGAEDANRVFERGVSGEDDTA